MKFRFTSSKFPSYSRDGHFRYSLLSSNFLHFTSQLSLGWGILHRENGRYLTHTYVYLMYLLPAFRWMEESSELKKSFSQTCVLEYPTSFSLLCAYSHTITCQYHIFHFICFVFRFPTRCELFENRHLSCLLLYHRTWHLIFIEWAKD